MLLVLYSTQTKAHAQQLIYINKSAIADQDNKRKRTRANQVNKCKRETADNENKPVNIGREWSQFDMFWIGNKTSLTFSPSGWYVKIPEEAKIKFQKLNVINQMENRTCECRWEYQRNKCNPKVVETSHWPWFDEWLHEFLVLSSFHPCRSLLWNARFYYRKIDFFASRVKYLKLFASEFSLSSSFSYSTLNSQRSNVSLVSTSAKTTTNFWTFRFSNQSLICDKTFLRNELTFSSVLTRIVKPYSCLRVNDSEITK